MIDNLIQLKNRAQNLRYKDKSELDDIQRKTKMYLEKIFPMKFTYPGEVDAISFYPTYFVSGMGDGPYLDAWTNGKQELINLLDTRIEEARIELQKNEHTKQPAIQVVEKVIKVEDHSRINELNQEIKALRSSKKLWERINWAALITILVSLVGGSFFFGKYIGESRFDKEKIDLYESNKNLTLLNDSLYKENETQRQEILNLTRQLPTDTQMIEARPLKVTISYLSPISIFNGEILISAKDGLNAARLNFTGIEGLSKIEDGKFDSSEIEVKKGDRFYFKTKYKEMWIVNVLATEVSVSLEILNSK